MKILIVEDDQVKRDEIRQYIMALGVTEENVPTAADMAEFMARFDDEIDVCIVDLRFPAYEGADIASNGIGVIQAIEKKGSHPKLLAISAYPAEFEDIRSQFEARGCMLVDFDKKDVWQNILKQMLIEIQRHETMDFLIFCALRAERAPYTGMAELNPQPKFRDNLTRLDIDISDKRGSVIELPRMGLVDAAIVAGRCIEKFKPKYVAMSGICAGFPGRADLGQLLVSDFAYEYQSGKWTTDGFTQEPYQSASTEEMRIAARQLIDDPDLLLSLEAGWRSNRPTKITEPKISTFTSGSAVIASEKYIEQVSAFHRRVSGLDMEIYALHRAAHISSCKPEVLCAKVVVDLAGSNKDDHLQPYGCFISARFVVELLKKRFLRN